jgi:hypothetical protein
MSLPRLSGLAAVLFAALMAGGAWAAGDSLYTDPWAPNTEAAAQAASVRLGSRRSLAIVPKVLNILGLPTPLAAPRSERIDSERSDQPEASPQRSSTNATIRAKAASPPLKRNGKQPSQTF